MKGPWRVTFDTNPDDCNLRCIMCEEFSPYSNLKQLRMLQQNTPKRRIMPIELIEKVMDQLSGYDSLREIIPSTMGEPLLYQEFERIIELCHEYKVKLNLTTNGSFPKKSAKEWAELIVPVGSDVKISWNGATKETQESVMLNSDYEQHLFNLKQFLHVRDEIAKNGGNYCSVTLQITFMETNYREFPDLVKMAAKLGVDRIKGHHLWTHFEQIKEQSMRRNLDAIKRWNVIVKQMRENAKMFLRPNGTEIVLDNIFELDQNSTVRLLKNSVCPFLKEEAWIAWNGRFNPCCAPDQLRKSLGYFGNVNDTSFYKIWEGNEYKSLTNSYKEHPLCKNCNMRRPIS